MPRPLTLRLLCVWLAIAASLTIAGCEREAPAQPGVQLAGLMFDAQLAELSGLAASRRHRNVLWMHDDGGNPARLFAISTTGERLATFRIEGVTKTDWEDMAAFDWHGRRYLLVADIGDNGGLRRTLQLHVIEEPAQLENARLKPAWSIAFRWPDGARDCEAVAVDATRGEILLISKKRQPPELFSVPLQPQNGQLQTARLLGRLAGVPQPDPETWRQSPQRARQDTQITAADISPDGNTLAVMTYRHLLLYPRQPNQTWARAASRAPRVIVMPWIPQGEAMGWAANGRSLYASGEFAPAPLYQISP